MIKDGVAEIVGRRRRGRSETHRADDRNREERKGERDRHIDSNSDRK